MAAHPESQSLNEGTTRSMWVRVWGAASLVHPFPAATVVTISAVLLVVAYGRYPPIWFLLRAVAAVAMTQIATGALNDFLDRESDAVGQPWKPIPDGRATPGTALALVALGAVGTLVLSATFGPQSVALLALALSGGLVYDLWLKPTPFSVTGYLVGFLALVTWIWYVAGQLVPLFALAYPLGAAAVITAHLAQSAPDIESDRARGQHGLAAELGVSATQELVRIGLAAMICGSLALAVAARSAGAIALVAGGALAGASILVARASRGLDPRRRRAQFRQAAIAIGLMSIGSLAALNALIH